MNQNHSEENCCDLNRVFVIIPALNEEATIGSVIKSLQSYGLTKICVVDNGSSDRTKLEACSAGAEIISEPVSGYGRACWRGLQQVPDEYDWILFCDGDGSDDLSKLPEFFAAAKDADFILGNRRATASGRAAMTPIQNFGNWLATLLIGWGWGYWYRDLGPLRLIRRSALEKIQMRDRSFGWTVEMQAKAFEYSLKICEIPVGYRHRQGGRSKISGTLQGSFWAGSIILATLGSLYLQRLNKQRKNFRYSRFALWLSSLLLLLGAVLILPHGDFQQAGTVPRFWWGIGVMSLGFVLSWTLHSLSNTWFWSVTILSRLLLLPMYPGDDIWRYLWEGHIQNLGFSPYDLPPNAPELIPYRTDWWELMNHLGTSAIYPPLTQLGFRALALISTSVLLFKLAFVLADLGICWLLSKNRGDRRTLLYAWNPLVIYSFAGGGHYDSWFILPLVAGWLAFDKRHWAWSALLIGLSVAIKWMSLPILVFLALRVRGKYAPFVLLLGILPMLVTGLWFCHDRECSLIPTSSTFVSHGRSAEFIPYLVSLVWYPSTQQNWIYGIPLGLVAIALLWRCRSFVNFVEWYFFALLALSPIVHAWYFTWSIPWAVATRNLGVRWVSLSAFVYFILKHRQSLGNFDWRLTSLERYWLWLPFVLGFLWIKFCGKSTANISFDDTAKL
ncbi:glycosyltransferase [Pleurocapsales cyanobacterium LEGE 06147]|nr:glycosyltransferase [Pleurocapsales cyanobacterium LEGE 06147]